MLEESEAHKEELEEKLKKSEAEKEELKEVVDKIEAKKLDLKRELERTAAEKKELTIVLDKRKLKQMRELQVSKAVKIACEEQSEVEIEAVKKELELSKVENITFKKVLEQRELELQQVVEHMDKKVTLEKRKLHWLQHWQKSASEKERLQCLNVELEKQLEDVMKKNISIEEEEDEELEFVDDAWLKV
ncbi:hypothetical protein M0R45_035528 [Rubus argutus]|uniref:Uncharacterized protein n=1 Tax=Rubus argutus TaxID=59490 RepID=A0AAW1VXW1_RUBAR